MGFVIVSVHSVLLVQVPVLFLKQSDDRAIGRAMLTTLWNRAKAAAGVFMTLRAAFIFYGLVASGALTGVLFLYADYASIYWRDVSEGTKITVSICAIVVGGASLALVIQSVYDSIGRRARKREGAAAFVNWVQGNTERWSRERAAGAAARAQASVERRRQVEALRRAVIEVYEYCVSALDHRGAEPRAREAISTFRVEAQSMRERLDDETNARIASLDEHLNIAMGRGKDVDREVLRIAAEHRDAIAATLSRWLDRMRV